MQVKSRTMSKKDTQFKAGESGNPEGKKVGTRNFKTLFNEAIIKIAEETGEAPLDIERDIVTKGAIMARKGDYRFYKDLLDRVHGKAEEKIDVKANINFIMNQDLTDRDDISPSTKESSTE